MVEPPAPRRWGRPGSSSASRQTWMSGGAVLRACRLVADQVRLGPRRPAGDGARERWWRRRGRPHRVGRGPGRSPGGVGRRPDRGRGGGRPRPTRRRPSTATGRPCRSTSGARARPTSATCSPPTGPSSTSTPTSGWCGWCRSPPARTSAGCCTRPRSPGQIEGGIAQGVGLAVMEEIVVDGGLVQEPQLHRLPHPHRGRRPRGAGHLHRAARARGRRSAPRGWASRRRSRRPRRWWRPSGPPPASTSAGWPVRPWDLCCEGGCAPQSRRHGRGPATARVDDAWADRRRPGAGRPSGRS